MMLARSSSVSVGSKGEKHTLVGRSRAGDGTCFALLELKVREYHYNMSNKSIYYVPISHAHFLRVFSS
jgi:hypothetical protein